MEAPIVSPKAPTFVYNAKFETEDLVLLATDFSLSGEPRIYVYAPFAKGGGCLTPATFPVAGRVIDKFNPPRQGISFNTLCLLVIGFFSHGERAKSRRLILADQLLSYDEALRLDAWLTELKRVDYNQKFPSSAQA